MADLIIRELRVERGGRPVLNGCSADFPSGRRTVLWGRSGTGKSTLLTAIAGLLVPRSGAIALGSRVFFSSADEIDLPPYDRRVGFVFQDLALWPHLSAIDHVYLVGRPAGLDRSGAHALLRSVGLQGLEGRRPGQLSGGEQQRLAIVRALAGRPSVLLLDEPLSSVDRKTKDSLCTPASRGLGTRPRPKTLRDASRRGRRQPGRNGDDARGRTTRASGTPVGERVTGLAKCAWRTVALGITLFGVEAAAQEPSQLRTDAPQARARRVTGTIRIDGRLDEPDWDSTPSIGALTQREPLEGRPASEPTDVRVLFSDTSIYIGMVCHETHPNGLISTQDEGRQSRRG